MGGGSWSSSTYAATTSARIADGTTFSYDRTARFTGRFEAHEDLDPLKVAGVSSPLAGQIVRESRDNAEHPNALPIAVFFDATGSMGTVPRVTQEKLAGLFGLLLRKGYAEDPQVLIGAYGDAYTDRVPLQVSQFESDNRIDENLDKLFLEGGGGGNGGETITLPWYYLANHTVTDSLDKRGKKGYAFFVADEVGLPLQKNHVSKLNPEATETQLTVEAIAEAVKQKWDVYILLIDNMASRMQGSEAFYKKLFGSRNVLVVEDPNSVTETIALTIGALEGNLDFDDAEDDLKATGSSDLAIRSAVTATSHLGRTSVVKSSGFDLDAL